MMVRPQPRASDNDLYFLGIEGLPLACDWQEVKDHARRFAQHVGHVMMAQVPDPPTHQICFIKLSNEEQARRLFVDFYRNGFRGYPVFLHLWDTSGREPALIWDSNYWRTGAVQVVQQMLYLWEYDSRLGSTNMVYATPGNVPTNTMNFSYTPVHMSQCGIPACGSGREPETVVKVEVKNIVVRNLDGIESDSDIRALLQPKNVAEWGVELRDWDYLGHKRKKVSATYNTAAAAMYMANRLNGLEIKGGAIEAAIGKDAENIEQDDRANARKQTNSNGRRRKSGRHNGRGQGQRGGPDPVIVNGSE